MLEQLGCPQRHLPAIHIGGTNGKGSVAVFVYSALRAAGHRTALYTSPHLVDIRERMIVDEQPISRAAFAAWTSTLHATIERTGASFFEATTAIALADFCARGAEVAVVEVGLGGRLDSTNVVEPLASCVTQVQLEHIDYLGDSLEGIAREKAGIAKPGVPFVIGEPDDAIADVLASVATAADARARRVPPVARYGGALSMRGNHQRRNAAVAHAVLGQLASPFCPAAEAIATGFARARLPGRLEYHGRWILDVAHNPAGVETVVAELSDRPPPGPVHALVGILGDKDWVRMVQRLATVADRLWVTQPPSAPPARRWELERVRAEAGVDMDVQPDFDEAFAAVQADAATILVTGSFHTVGDAMARLPGFAPLG